MNGVRNLIEISRPKESRMSIFFMTTTSLTEKLFKSNNRWELNSKLSRRKKLNSSATFTNLRRTDWNLIWSGRSTNWGTRKKSLVDFWSNIKPFKPRWVNHLKLIEVQKTKANAEPLLSPKFYSQRIFSGQSTNNDLFRLIFSITLKIKIDKTKNIKAPFFLLFLPPFLLVWAQLLQVRILLHFPPLFPIFSRAELFSWAVSASISSSASSNFFCVSSIKRPWSFLHGCLRTILSSYPIVRLARLWIWDSALCLFGACRCHLQVQPWSWR